MKICFLSSYHPPYDKRVHYKEAMSLEKNGFEVTHIAPSHGTEVDNRSMDPVKQVLYRTPSGLVGRFMQLPRLLRLALRENADCYHCNEVDSWLVGVVLKVFRRKKIVFDAHEVYPEEFAESRFPKVMQPAVIFCVRLLYRMLLPFTDRVVFAKESVSKDFKGSEEKHVLVQNYVPAITLTAIQVGASGPHIHDVPDVGPVRVVHIGGMSRQRCWPELLRALTLVSNEDIILQIIGDFPDRSLDSFEKQSEELGLKKRIVLETWMPFQDVFRKILSAHVGLILLRPEFSNHVYALPHKMFDYMLAGLPIIVPKCAVEVTRIVKEADCGVIVDSSDPRDIARGLDLLAEDRDERKRLGRNGREAVLNKYNWESEAEKLVLMYQELRRERKVVGS